MNVTPPKWADRFLRWYCNPLFLEEIEGDVYELFDRRAEEKGPKAARIKFIWDVFRFFRWSNIKKSNSKYTTMNRSVLFRNYLKLGFRNIQKNLVSSAINIVGLSIAICFAISIFIFTDMQLHMDTFHTKGDRIYQLTNYVAQKGEAKKWSDSPLLLAPQLKADHPSIEAVARLEYQYASIRFNTNVFDELVTFVDPSYMEMFDFPLLNGNKQVLYDKGKVVISRDMAIKYFNDQDPMGQELSFKFSNGVIKRMTVGAVMDKQPYNSSFRHDFYVPIQNFLDLKLEDNYDWSYLTDATFVLMKEGESISSLTDSYENYIELQHGSNPEWEIEGFYPIPLQKISVEGYDIVGSISATGHPAGRIALITIAILLLGMACFNFMNISVVSATKRLKEIALRKVMGGIRKQIIGQFLVENIIQCFIALALGILLAYFLLIPWFQILIPELDIEFRSVYPMSIVIFLVSLLLVVGVISGAYPAFYISRFEPVAIFKGTQKFGSKNFFSKIMLGLQLFLAIMTIVGGLVMTDESMYLSQKDWGYDPKGSLSVYVNNEEQYELLKNEMISHPSLQTYAASNYLIGRGVPMKSLEYEDKQLSIRTFGVSGGYFETFQLRLKEGRFLTDQIADQKNAVVVNEMFVKEMGWKDSPINQTFTYDSIRRTVVGVVEDFHYYDFFSEINPVIFHGLDPSRVQYLSMRTDPEKVEGLEQFSKEAWLKIAPNDPFDRVYQEDVFDGFYAENKSNISILMLVSGMAIVLACLGLYGLLSFNIQSKLKEFGVRKVLGATPKALVKIASKQYSWVLIIAFVLGAPLGFLGMNQLVISVFPDPRGFSILPFIVAMVIISATLALTVAGQIKRAIKVNPAETLRNE
jgi:putative ABC transport system permease protein